MDMYIYMDMYMNMCIDIFMDVYMDTHAWVFKQGAQDGDLYGEEDLQRFVFANVYRYMDMYMDVYKNVHGYTGLAFKQGAQDADLYSEEERDARKKQLQLDVEQVCRRVLLCGVVWYSVVH